MMSKESESAMSIFEEGFNCSQAVMASHCEAFGITKELAYKISSAFGGGMGRIGETCGAVTGALLLIGLKHGKYKKDDVDSKDKTYAIVKEFTDQFKNKYGSIKCSDLIKFDISIPEELLKARESGVFKTSCPYFVKGSVELVEKYL
jgi:C_GCAxxG_C_C family probable redox protein